MISALLAGLAGPWRLWAELAVVGVLLILLGAQNVRLHGAQAAEARARAETSDVRREWAEQAAAATSAALRQSEQNRQITAELQRTKEEAEHARESDRLAAAAAAASFATERAGLRQQLAAYAAGPAPGRGSADDSLSACRDRADRLGNVLAEGVRLQDELAGDAEDRAADARRLLDAWPKVAD